MNWCNEDGCVEEPHIVGYCSEHFPPFTRATGRFKKTLLRCLEAIENHDLLYKDPEIEGELNKIVGRKSTSAHRLSAIIVKRCKDNPDYGWWFGTDSFCEICEDRLYSEKFSPVSQEVKRICESHEICKKCNVVIPWDDSLVEGLCPRCDHHELWDHRIVDDEIAMEEEAPSRPDINCFCGAKPHETEYTRGYRVRLALVDFGGYSKYLCEECHGEKHDYEWWYTND